MSGAWGGGKGDEPRPIQDRRTFEETMDKLCGDYCRFPHVHTKDCKIKGGSNNGTIRNKSKRRDN